ncbi:MULTISPECIES: DUF488 domain-containing protein [Gardnerella]|jgi:transcriptional regulator, MarR family|uniref:DUF488 domain-containing protein n=1 Tax=Gardnerella vaginalis TaxID=2702 RepID=A0ABD4Z944_GARVA|nr:DUF488 domain-containing protein [Gardnerella vaginalis]AEF31432.1 hypothetical protein HMPREF9231_0857 [Gardnerella vaginalis HMP9231]EGL13961.1 hypothetical protein HMPREF9435_0795 [Gardnerella vaginalis 315-A]MDK6695272.1 DUF488 domain-containing protein [Gardnerella vaginalis]NSX23861.1 DUF488 domain-containing protein [Gardnerella vaginalis]NSX24831.1 DUF488 domain-containing protein [Gardnerella vaginalis]
MCNINIQVKRIYESSDEHDGLRVLVDRLWPRGISKEKANLDLWCKDIAPSSDLRKWFGHKSERFEEFANRYIEELDENQDCVNQIVDICRKNKKVTFLYGAKDLRINHAIVLKDYIQNVLQN